MSRITVVYQGFPRSVAIRYNIWYGHLPIEPTTRPLRRRWRGPLSGAAAGGVHRSHPRELGDTLARVRESAALPWKDLTAATLAELRFNSIAGWLPEDEASALRAAFQCEINRLYLIAEADDKT